MCTYICSLFYTLHCIKTLPEKAYRKGNKQQPLYILFLLYTYLHISARTLTYNVSVLGYIFYDCYTQKECIIYVSNITCDEGWQGLSLT